VGKVTGDRVYGLTTPLVTRADGSKFGKTAEGAVWLDGELTSPYRFYQFFLNVEDAGVGQYLRFFTFLAHDEIEALDEETRAHPERRLGQRALARALTDLVHGQDERERAERAAEALFADDLGSLDEATLLEVFEDAPSSELAASEFDGSGPGPIDIVDVLMRSGLCTSKSDARREIAGGGIYVNNRPVADPERTLGPDDLLAAHYVVLRKGRRNYHLLRVK
jgi:tyrosyl-tRNA synthetase